VQPHAKGKCNRDKDSADWHPVLKLEAKNGESLD
jgi:hypothetical protein